MKRPAHVLTSVGLVARLAFPVFVACSPEGVRTALAPEAPAALAPSTLAAPAAPGLAPSAPSASAALAPAAVAPSAPAARPRLEIASVAVGGYGEMVKTREGKELMVLHPNQWPAAILAYAPGGPGFGSVRHDVRDPLVADLLAGLRRVPPGKTVHALALAQSIRWLEVCAIVMDPDWSDLVLTNIVRRRANSFEISLTKHGVSLDAGVYRGGEATYTEGYRHSSTASVELHWFGAELIAPFRNAKLGPHVQPALRDEMVRLLAKPATSTPTEAEN